jgi:hypothetical protein
MKINAVRSLIIISLVTLLIVAGTTMAWFTDDYTIPSAAEMVVGTLDFEITDACVIPEDGEEGEGGGDSQTIEWNAGECKELSWTFENTGTKTAFFRARPEGTFKQYTGKDDSAWGEGPPFNEGQQGNWAMYFEYDGLEKTVRLMAGQNIDAGTVRVWQEGGKLYVEIQTKDGWKMIDSHVHLAENVDDFPIAGNGNGNGNGNQNPIPGKFDYKKYHYLAESYTYEIDLPEFSPALIAVHSCLVQGTETTEGTINWSLPDDSPWEEGVDSEGGFDGWYYYCQPVRSGEEITLVLRGCLDEDAADGSYEVKLKAESVQTSHGAAGEEWPGWPGGQ